MSMYTQLLDAAYGERPHPREEGSAVAEVLRCRFELEERVPPGIDPDAVPVVLALQVGYDVALLGLAAWSAWRRTPAGSSSPNASVSGWSRPCGTWVFTSRCRSSKSRPPTPEGQERRRYVPLASERDSCARRSLRRAANVAACVRRSMPSLASRLET